VGALATNGEVIPNHQGEAASVELLSLPLG
jgi:hypothetical protein